MGAFSCLYYHGAHVAAGEVIWRPRDLYDELAASEGGISEWIFPLVAAKHVDRYIWIRPPWATKALEDGTFSFHVGELLLEKPQISGEDDKSAINGPLRCTR